VPRSERKSRRVEDRAVAALLIGFARAPDLLYYTPAKIGIFLRARSGEGIVLGVCERVPHWRHYAARANAVKRILK
jgi:hypothetical protein